MANKADSIDIVWTVVVVLVCAAAVAVVLLVAQECPPSTPAADAGVDAGMIDEACGAVQLFEVVGGAGE